MVDDGRMKRKIISTDSEVMGGTPCFAGTRVPVQTLLNYLGAGESIDDFLEGFPDGEARTGDRFPGKGHGTDGGVRPLTWSCCWTSALTARLARELPGHFIRTVPQMDWATIKNGRLLRLAEKEFDVFITVEEAKPSPAR